MRGSILASRLQLVAALFASMLACEPSAPPSPTTTTTPVPLPAAPVARLEVLDDTRLVAGELPSGPGSELLRGRCVVCHSTDYVTQQRLTAAQWDKTIAKMQKWGAVLQDDEKAQLATFLAATWRADLPERASSVVPAPAGAVAARP